MPRKGPLVKKAKLDEPPQTILKSIHKTTKDLQAQQKITWFAVLRLIIWILFAVGAHEQYIGVILNMAQSTVSYHLKQLKEGFENKVLENYRARARQNREKHQQALRPIFCDIGQHMSHSIRINNKHGPRRQIPTVEEYLVEYDKIPHRNPTHDQIEQALNWPFGKTSLYELQKEAKQSLVIPVDNLDVVANEHLMQRRLVHAYEFLEAWDSYLRNETLLVCQDETGVWSHRLGRHRHTAPKGQHATCDCTKDMEKTYKINISLFITPIGILYAQYRNKNYKAIHIAEDLNDMMQMAKRLDVALAPFPSMTLFWDLHTIHTAKEVQKTIIDSNNAFYRSQTDDQDHEDHRWDLLEDDLWPMPLHCKYFPSKSPETNLCESFNHQIKSGVRKARRLKAHPTTETAFLDGIKDIVADLSQNRQTLTNYFLDKVNFAKATILEDGDYDKALTRMKDKAKLEADFNAMKFEANQNDADSSQSTTEDQDDQSTDSDDMGDDSTD